MRELLDHIGQGITDLSGYAMWGRTTDELTDIIDATAVQISRLTALQALALHELNGRESIHQDGASSAAVWLRNRVRCSPGAAAAVSRLGDVLDAHEPIREAVLSGSVSVEQAAVIGKALHTLDEGLSDLPAAESVAEASARAEIPDDARRTLLELSGQLGPIELRQVGERILTYVAPDLAEAAERRWVRRAEADAYRRRGVTIRPDGDTGMWRLSGLLDASDAATVQMAIGNRPFDYRYTTSADSGEQTADTTTTVGAADADGRNTADRGTIAGGGGNGSRTSHGAGGIGSTSRDSARRGNGSSRDSAGGGDGASGDEALRPGGGRLGSGDGDGRGDGPARDIRSAAQRRADALVEVCQRILAQGELPAHGGIRPQVTVTVNFDALTRQLGVGMLNTGALISPTEVRRLACDAFILPAVMSSAGAVLDLGNRTRLFTGSIRQALVLRDRGCAFPGCDRPPEWCQGHHIRHHADGGKTSLGNGVLLCNHHHKVVHHEGWEVFIDPVDQLPSFRPPVYLDIERKPLRNLMHRPLP